MWLPRGPSGGGDALDFACSSVLRTDRLRSSVDRAPGIFSEYEEFKRSFRDTGQHCEQAGFTFTPFIFEAHFGAWSPATRKVFDFIAQKVASSSSTFTTPEAASLHFAQRISTTLHRENARAIARKLVDVVRNSHESSWDTWQD